jgi:hypothetical protein
MQTINQRRTRKLVRQRRVNSNQNPEFLELCKFVETRFDKKYLQDFVKIYKQDPLAGKKLIKQWSEF